MIATNRRRITLEKGQLYDSEILYVLIKHNNPNSGKCRVHTDFIPKIGDQIYTKIMFIDYTYGSGLSGYTVFHTGTGTYRLLFRYVRNINGDNRGLVYRYFSDLTTLLAFTPTNNTWYQISTDSQGTLTFGNKTLASASVQEINEELYLLSDPNGGNYFAGRFASLYIMRDGVKVLDLIPVRKGSVGYIYDKISLALYPILIMLGVYTLGPDVVSNE